MQLGIMNYGIPCKVNRRQKVGKLSGGCGEAFLIQHKEKAKIDVGETIAAVVIANHWAVSKVLYRILC